MNISGGFPQSLRLGAAGGGSACPPPAPPAGGGPSPLLPARGCPPPPPPAGGWAGAGAGAGVGAGAGAGGTFGSTTLPLAMCAASLECVCVAIVGSMGDCRIVYEVRSSSLSECVFSLCDSVSELGDSGW